MIARFNLRVYAIIINENNELLLSHESRNGFEFVKFPGGGVEPGEGISDALSRELKEELNLDIKSKKFFFFNEDFQTSYARNTDQIICFYYKVILKKYPQKFERNAPLGSSDNTDFEYGFWKPLMAVSASDFTFPIDKIVVTEIQKEFLK